MLQRIALIPDLHCPDQDDRAVDLTCKVLEAAKVDRIIFLGDVLDMACFTHYDHDRGLLPGSFQKERDGWKKTAGRILSAAGTRIPADVLQGNHEFRYMRGFLWQMPQFRDFQGMSWGDILYAAELNVTWVPGSEIWLASRNFLVTHGKIVRKHSAYSAKAEFDDRGVSGASGHTHRMGQYFVTRTGSNKVYSWTECGHLSRNPPHYQRPNEGRGNWQQGFAIMAAAKSEYRVPELIPFWKHGSRYRARWQDKEFTA